MKEVERGNGGVMQNDEELYLEVGEMRKRQR